MTNCEAKKIKFWFYSDLTVLVPTRDSNPVKMSKKEELELKDRGDKVCNKSVVYVAIVEIRESHLSTLHK